MEGVFGGVAGEIEGARNTEDPPLGGHPPTFTAELTGLKTRHYKGVRLLGAEGAQGVYLGGAAGWEIAGG